MRARGYVELIIVAVIVVVAIALLLPLMSFVLSPSPHSNRPLPNTVHLRSMHQAFMTYAHDHRLAGQDGWYPGINPNGTLAEPSVAPRLKALLDGNYVGPDYLLNPADRHAKVWRSGTPFTPQNYSYALLEIGNAGGRRAEWSETLNTQAVVAGDRNTGADATTHVQSVWTSTPGDWRGSVVRNDNSVAFETDHFLSRLQYGEAAEIPNDNLFDPAGDDDAYLIHELPGGKGSLPR